MFLNNMLRFTQCRGAHSYGTLFRSQQRTWGFRSFSSSEAAEGKKSEESQEKKKKSGGGVPWGLLGVLAFVGAIGGYFYRGRSNGKARDKLKFSLEDDAALCPTEVEDIREANNLNVTHFDLLNARAKAKYVNKMAEPMEFFGFCGAMLNPATRQLKAGHLFERLGLRLEGKYEHKPVDLKLLMTAMTMTLGSPLEERMRVLFRLFTESGQRAKEVRMTQQQLESVVNYLIETHQLPTRCLVHEVNKYPFNIYVPSDAETLLPKAVEQVVKARKKEKIELGGYEEDFEKILKERLAYKDSIVKSGDDQQAIEKLEKPHSHMPNDPVWSLQDFEEILLSNAVCAWGECHR